MMQETLGDRGFSRVDVRDDADVADALDLGHGFLGGAEGTDLKSVPVRV